jgi:glycosyltransferase involved in cell wall biosynthesis
MSAFRPDVVVFHHLVRLSLLLPLLAAQQGVPSVYVAHDYYWVCPSYSLYAWDADVCPGGSPSRCAKCLYISRFHRPPGLLTRSVGAIAVAWRNHVAKRVLASVSLFVAPSAAVLTGLKERGLVFQDSACIRNGSGHFKHAPAVREKGAIRFGYIGNIAPKKGLNELAAAFRGRLGRQLVIRGFETEEERDRFRAGHPDLEARLEMFNDDRAGFFQQIDVLLVPSVWRENQPLVIIEAFAHHRPVIASRIGGIVEMFEDGRGGRLVEPGDAEELRCIVGELAANPELVDDLVNTIPQWPSWREMTGRLLDELDRIVRVA